MLQRITKEQLRVGDVFQVNTLCLFEVGDIVELVCIGDEDYPDILGFALCDKEEGEVRGLTYNGEKFPYWRFRIDQVNNWFTKIDDEEYDI